MDAEKRKVLEAAGWKLGDAADFLGMTDEERQMFAFRATIAQAVRRHREAANLSQKDLAGRIKTSQPRVAKIEQAAPDVTLDQMLRAFMAVGGRMVLPAKNGEPLGASCEIVFRGIADGPRASEPVSKNRKPKKG